MKHLKTFFAFMLMAVLSIGQVWAVDPVTISADFQCNCSEAGTSPDLFTASSGTAGSSYYSLAPGASIVSKISYDVDPSQSVSITMNLGTYGGYESGKNDVKFYLVDGEGKQVSTAFTSNFTAKYTTAGGKAFSGTVSLNEGEEGKGVYFKFVPVATSGSKYARFHTLSITYTPAAGGSEQSTVLITPATNNASYGTVSLSGTTITASPEAGYCVKAGNEGYTVTSGNATVTNNGDNTFTVSATEDCTVQINFEVIPTYTVTLKDDDSTLPQSSAGASVTLPSRDGCEGYTFAGWTKSWTSAQSTWTTTTPTIIDAGSYTPTANENLYPVYTKSEGQAEAWSLCSAANDVTEGTYVITWDNAYYLPSETTAAANPAVGSGITQKDDKLTNTVTSAMQWTFTGDNTNGFTVSHTSGSNTYYLGSADKAQGIIVATENSSYTWKASVDNNYGMLLNGVGSRYLAVYNSSGTRTWRYYATGTNYSGTLRLYKKTGGSTTSYISEPDCSAACEKKVTISAGTTPEHGSFELDKTGDQYTCDAAVDVIVTPTADDNYHVGTVSATTGETGVDNHDGTWTITYAQQTNAASTINVTFEEDTKYQVTWNVSGDETLKTNVYAGKKPVFPSNPSSCDATSTAFIGWATAAWPGKLDDLAGKTVYTKAADMPDVDAAVTYYAVFAETSGDASDLFSWDGGSSTALTALDNVTATGLGSDYAASNDPYLVKLDTDDDEIIITTSGEVGSVTINVKMIGGGTTSYIYVQEAEDAEGTFSTVETLEIRGAQNDEVALATSNAFKADSRVVKLLFKKGSNVGVGPISIVGAVHYSDYMTTCCTKYAVNIANGITNGSVSADLAQACEGTTVTLTFTPTTNYHLSAWTLNGTEQDIAENTFTMPGQAVTISATFEEDACDPLNTPSVTVSGKAYPYDAVKLTWTAIANADNYKVYIYDSEDNELEHNDAFTGVEYTIGQTFEAGTTYKYSVQAISNTPLVYCPSTEATGTFVTDALPTAHLTLIDIEGELDESGDYTILTPFALPDEAASCAKAFVGWDPDENCVKAPTYSKGAEFAFANTTDVTLYAVYATAAPGAATAVLSEDFSSITTGNSTATSGSGSAWTPNSNFSNSVTAIYQAGGAIRVGKSGSITTKSLDLSSGAVTVSFKLKGWSATENTVTVQVDNQTAQNATCTGYMSSGDFESKSLTFAAGTTTSVVKFTTSSSVRVFVDDIVISVPGASTYSAYSTTCGEAPTATPSSASIDVAAAGASSTLSIAYKNVKLADVTVALFNNATCTEAFNGGWLTASVEGDDKHIAYTAQAAVSYTETRTAYIKLTAPENSGVEEPTVVVIPVTQAKKDAVFASLEELVAAQLPSGTPAVVSFSNVLITEIYATSAGYRYGLYLNVKDKDGENNIEIFYNKQQNAEQVPADWVKNGKVSATSLAGTWTYYNSTWELAMQANDWTWADNISYTAPKAVSSVVVSGTPNKTSYVDGETFDPAGLTVTVNYNDLTNEVISATDADWEFTPAKLAKGNTSVEVVATYNTVSSEAFEVTGLTVGDIQVKTIAQFIAAGGTRCYLEGTVSNITNTTYGNFDLTDASGKIYVYGCLNANGESGKFDQIGVEESDKIKVLAETYEYYQSTTHEAKNVQFVEFSQIAVTSVSLNETSKSIPAGGSFTLTATVAPAKATNKAITWSSSNTAVATVENGVVTGVASGTATITATTVDGGYTANCSVTVLASHKLTLMTGGHVYVEKHASHGSSVWALLDDVTDPDIAGYILKGWSTTEAGTVLIESTAGTLDADMTLYAVYASANYSYQRVTSDLGTNWAGDYLIAYSDEIFADGRIGGKDNGIGKAGVKANPGNRLSNNEIDGKWGNNYCVTLEEVSSGSNTYVLKTKDGKYNYQSSNSNGLLDTENKATAAAYPITVTFTSANDIKLTLSNKAAFRYNSGSGGFFRYYKDCGQSAIYLYKKVAGDEGAPVSAPTITVEDFEEVKTSDIFADGMSGDLVVEGKVTVDQSTAPSIVAKEGATVTIVGDGVNPVESELLNVEEGSVIDVQVETTINDYFHISAKRGQGSQNSNPTKSGRIKGADKVHVASPAHFDFTLAVTGEDAANQWHDFSVPFPVNALTGVYGYRNGEWQKLTNEVDYAILDFHGDVRANGQYSWKKCRGELTPGKIYSLTVNGDIETFRFMKTAAPFQLESTPAHYKFYSSTSTDESRHGWNGLGNSRMDNVTVGGGVTKVYILVYDEDYPSGGYKFVDASKITLMIGSAFLVQTETDDEDVDFGAPSEAEDAIYYAPARSESDKLSEVLVTLSDGRYTDNLYLSASEDATNSYQIGKDMTKLFVTTTPVVPTLYTTNYNGVKLASEHAPLYGNSVDYALTLFAPKAGEYTIASTQTEDNVYLTYNGEVIWNLSSSAYMLYLAQGAEESYGIRIVRAPKVATGAENGIDSKVTEAGVQKIILDEHVYILRNGQRYDVTGKIAK